ncbi:ATP-binding protein [Tahibacter amnicola]|uniref:histidine kinase n=1 Tax=Tahibacter amnicola TaxID=2976241 RepID=A0ABY6BBM5_9GAMM|nr:ATP-binding protein [Tahibacter amnicola]UXI67217.1 ATP-binding protein [Tahibacter amnicola]
MLGNPAIAVVAATFDVKVEGAVVGRLLLSPLPAPSGDLAQAFAATQWRQALVAALVILVGAVVLAFALARWLLQPIRALAEGTSALADGDYSRRLPQVRNDELGALSNHFNHLASTLEQHQQARRDWGADIAHELRTPLSILQGEIQAMQDGVRPMNATALNSLHAECARLAALIDDLYQLSLADAGALDYRFAPMDLGEVLMATCAAQSAACTDAGLTLELAPLPATVLPVRGDEGRLNQLLANLIGNSRRYTDAPGRIRITATRLPTHWSVDIDDTPPGVPPESLPRLFDRLYRVDRSRNRAHGGAGLGLAICRAIVQAHGGSIEAHHSPLGGLRVRLRLPIAEKD